MHTSEPFSMDARREMSPIPVSPAIHAAHEPPQPAPPHSPAAPAVEPSAFAELAARRRPSPLSGSPIANAANEPLQAMPSLSASVIDLSALAELARKRGLTLRPGGALRLLRAEQTSLSDTGRLLLDDGILPPLIEAFADSPYLTGDAAETLAALTELFYHLKNETDDRIPDERLLQAMRQHFDEPCRGSTEWLADLLGEGRL